MAIEVELPDGSIVEFPEGTDNATMERALAQYAQPKPSFDNVQGGSQQEAQVAGQAPSQMGGFKQAAYGLVSPVANAIAGVGQMTGLMDEQDVQASRQRIDAVRDTTPGKVAGFAGDVGMLAFPLSKVGALPKAQQYAASMIGGGAFAGLQPVSEGEDRGNNIMLGGALGAAGQGGSDLLMHAGKRAATAVAPEVRTLYDKAKAYGINLTPAQLSDSELLKRVVGMFEKMPFSGAAGRAKAQNDAGNSALAQMLGQKKGDVLNAQTFDRALSDIGGKFDQAFASGMTYGRDFLRDIATLKREAVDQMDDTAVRTINSLVERVRKQGAGGQLSGRTLQSLDQAARKAATGGGDRQAVAQEFRSVLHDAFGKAAPAGKRELWNEARQQYAQAMQLMPLVAKNPDGGVPLAQLQGAITVGNQAKRARARGRDGEMGAIASIGQRIKGQTSSGTIENALASQALNPLAWPIIAASAIVGRTGNALLNNSGLARLLMREGRGQTRQALAPYARTAVPAAAAQERTDESRKRK